ncbi:hypothetical protein [Paenibacillus sp. UMB4589-SE434]|uniref:hypothetical protein n=1 Tax=Paenibacillus sp. UMB4589-SE434 TaxID=3046314 RepID=UPI00255159B7|nr:hypothetical protein [Paenibacillus sp. UMB4589-SE434]MDK8179613.1 hypothetical protein [Paenibacillus sp. UMB4589-SE434]
MWFKIIMWIVLIGGLLLQIYLSRRSSWVWGGIIPAIVVISTVIMFNRYDLSFTYSNMAPFVLYLVLQLSIWSKERVTYQKKLQKELEKMNAIDFR